MTDSLVQSIIPMTRAVLPVIIILGAIGNSLNIAILTRSTLNKYACSHYFLALAINNLIYSTIFLIVRLLDKGYQLTSVNDSMFGCKLYMYTFGICIFLSPYFIILASIDRYCASSTSATRRQFSSVYVARWAIFCTIIFFMVSLINSIINSDVQPDGFGCNMRVDSLYKQLYGIFSTVAIGILPPPVLIIFGLMTIRNTKRLLVAPVGNSHQRRTEYQLARMLLLQVGVYLVLTLPISTVFLMSILPTEARTTPDFAAIYAICQFLLDFSYATPFILYIITGSIYRKELKKLFYKVLSINDISTVHPLGNLPTVAANQLGK